MKLISRLIMATVVAGILVLVPGGCPADSVRLAALRSLPDIYWVNLDQAIQLYDPAPPVPDPEQP